MQLRSGSRTLKRSLGSSVPGKARTLSNKDKGRRSIQQATSLNHSDSSEKNNNAVKEEEDKEEGTKMKEGSESVGTSRGKGSRKKRARTGSINGPRVDTISSNGYYSQDFKGTDYRERPDLYRVGKGEQGVLMIEPYKGELLPLWRFRTPDIARDSAVALYDSYEGYKGAGDFVGMDMARKYIQMGWTRSMRYANHRSGHKYIGPVPDDKKGQSGAHGREVAPLDPDPIKRECASFFREQLDIVLADPVYKRMRQEHVARYER